MNLAHCNATSGLRLVFILTLHQVSLAQMGVQVHPGKLDLLDPQVDQDQKGKLANQVPLDREVTEVPPDPLVPQDLQDKLGQLDHLDRQERGVTQVIKDNQEKLVLLGLVVQLGQLVLRVRVVMQDHRVQLGSLDQLDQQDQLVHKAKQDRLVSLVQGEKLVALVLLDHKVHREQLAPQVPQVRVGQVAQGERKALKDPPVKLDQVVSHHNIHHVISVYIKH